MQSPKTPKVLIATSANWAVTARLALAMAKSGIAVGAVAPYAHMLHQLDRIGASFVCNSLAAGPASVRAAIRKWQPDFIIPCDDPAVGWLHRLHADAPEARDLIEASLGNPKSFSIARSRAELIWLAASMGIDTPHTQFANDIEALNAGLAKLGLPLVLKSEGSWGGLGVRIAATQTEASRAFAELREPPRWRRVVKDLLQDGNLDTLRRRSEDPGVTTLQAHIAGRAANRAVFCVKGRIIAGLNVEVRQNAVTTGPATVAHIVEAPAMDDVAARLVAALELSGFVGFDFIIERETGRPKLLEMNPRPTQICHMGGLMEAFAAHLGGPRRAVEAAPVGRDIAFFPQEFWRDPASPYLRHAYHDVPWDEPQFIDYCLSPPPPGWIDRLQALLAARPRLSPSSLNISAAVTDREPI